MIRAVASSLSRGSLCRTKEVWNADLCLGNSGSLVNDRRTVLLLSRCMNTDHVVAVCGVYDEANADVLGLSQVTSNDKVSTWTKSPEFTYVLGNAIQQSQQ